jgi:hypothetical protein
MVQNHKETVDFNHSCHVTAIVVDMKADDMETETAEKTSMLEVMSAKSQ